MRIQRIKFENWRGFRGVAEFGLKGVRAISGRNGLGKSTFADAVSFVLCGCNAQGVADFERRPVTDKEPMRGAMYAVTLEIEHNGEITVLTRGERDVETRKRGTTEVNYKSEGVREVDGVPVSVAEFEATIARLCETDNVKGLTFADWIFSLPVAQRRAYLLQLASEEERAEVQRRASEATGNICDEFKEGETAAMYKKRAVAYVSEMKKERDANHAKIEENFAQLTNVTAPTDEEIKALNAELKRIKSAKVGEELAEVVAEIGRVAKEKQAYITKAENERNERVRKMRAEIQQKEYRRDDANYSVKRLKDDLKHLEEQAAKNEERFTRARETYAKTREALQVVPEIPVVCEHCGQSIPDHLRAEWHAKEIARVKQATQQQLNYIIAQAEEIKAQINSNKAAREKIAQEITSAGEIVKIYGEEIAALKCEIETIEAEAEMIEAIDYVVELNDKLEALHKESERIQQATAGDTDEREQRINEIQKQLAEAQTRKTQADEDVKRQARILELQERNKNLADEIASAEQKKIKAEEYERLLAEGITASVNAKFPEGVEWKFTEPQANGGLADIADVYVNGVNIKDVNNAQKIVYKLLITISLQLAHGVNVPIFVDNAESVNVFPIFEDRQVIALVVSEQEKLTFS